MRQILLGRSPDRRPGRQESWRSLTWARIRRLNRNPGLAPLLEGERGSPDLYERVFRLDVATLTGRVHGGLGYAEGRAARYVGLADDAMKAALFGVVAARYRLVGHTGTTLVLEVPGCADAEASASEVRAIATRAAEGVLGSVPVACTSERLDRW